MLQVLDQLYGIRKEAYAELHHVANWYYKVNGAILPYESIVVTLKWTK
jgi:hypothetical protein